MVRSVDDYLKLVNELKGKKAVVGWFPSARSVAEPFYPQAIEIVKGEIDITDAIKIEGKSQYLAQIAFWNEFGTSIAPPRAFIRPTITDKRNDWVKKIKILAKNGNDATGILTGIGLLMVGDIRRTISSTIEPPLSEFTLALRQLHGRTSTTPLRDTQEMYISLTNVVQEQ